MSGRGQLLVALDDDEEIVDVIAAVGRRAGYEVEGVVTAAAFRQIVGAREPDVIVLDLQMPEVDGIETLRWLADEKSQAGIVLVSGMDERTIASTERYASSRGLKILAALQKPFVPDELFDELLAARAQARPLTSEDVRKAVEEQQLTVYYQPTIRRFADGSWDIATLEALLRWEHPTRGLLGPDAFMGLGEAHGLSRTMTDFVIQRGVEQLKAWQSLRLNVGLRVNIAATLIADIEFPDRLQRILVEQDIAPASLTLEITETAMLDHDPDTIDILTRLRLKDINLAIDDFGIGYSSLTQLFRMPFNEMKIDKSLTLRVPHSREARIMVEALIGLAHQLNLSVCAEGVETEEALAFLASVACDSAQGFYISRPIPSHKVPDVVNRWDRRPRAAKPRDVA